MKDKLPKIKLFTIFISIFYIFGILAIFLTHEIIFSLFALTALLLGLLFKIFDNKKILILAVIFFLGIFRAQNIVNYEKTFIDKINLNDVELFGQIISSKNLKKETNRLKFYVNANEIKISVIQNLLHLPCHLFTT